jgi:rhodanese-related sulfurtransferase
VPGARSFPLGSLDAALMLDAKTVSRSRPLYLICHTQNRSKIAAERFAAAGHPRVSFVLGGTAGWIAAGLPVSSGAPSSLRASVGSTVRVATAK